MCNQLNCNGMCARLMRQALADDWQRIHTARQARRAGVAPPRRHHRVAWSVVAIVTLALAGRASHIANTVVLVIAAVVGIIALGVTVAIVGILREHLQVRDWISAPPPRRAVTHQARQIEGHGPAAVEGGTHYHQHLHVEGIGADELARALRRDGDQ